MKKTSALSICIFLLLAASASAQNNGTSANGDFAFVFGGRTISMQFDARRHANGSIHGTISFKGEMDIPDQDVDGIGLGGGGGLVDVTMTVEVDCLKVTGNRAVMSGEITAASQSAYVGRRALLAVEDGGEGSKSAKDMLVWGVYGMPENTWVASDAELEFDAGVGLQWFATDAERDDDIGISSSKNLIVDCSTFPLAAYSLEVLPHGSGNIQVRP